jgi:hypothetical protein
MRYAQPELHVALAALNSIAQGSSHPGSKDGSCTDSAVPPNANTSAGAYEVDE